MAKSTNRGDGILRRDYLAMDFGSGSFGSHEINDAAAKARGDAERIFGKYEAALRTDVGRAIASQVPNAEPGKPSENKPKRSA